MTIVEFLTARLAEDEADAMASPGDQRWEADPVNESFAQVVSSDGGVTNGVLQTSDAVHVARWDPARVLAEVAAKRRVIEMTPVVYGLNDPTAEAHHMLVLAHLASVYADHEDYFVGWSP